uniref:Phospholipase-like protein n=1 Tax=Tanacetum cinerariifolium TaxID=118510 RepID=A0A699IFJ7_TANCI|nr:hypothetical protein [Tanacetum cinerariifolium]
MLGRQLKLTDDEKENNPLYYHVVDSFQIQFGREEFCLLTGLKFGVENWTDYNDEKEPIPFRRRAYFDERNIEEECIPRHLNRNSYFEVTSEMYRELEEQRRGYKQMMDKRDDMYEKMSRFMKDMSVAPVPLAKEPIIADQHYRISDLSGY